MNKEQFKIYLNLKKKINQAAFKTLLNKQEGHSKVNHIDFLNFEAQKYMKSYLFKTDEKQLLFKLRTRMTNKKSNFKSMHEKVDCNLCN